ncbi:MAG: type II secretion system minor pseudopilin GspK [Thalassotalea sp.]
MINKQRGVALISVMLIVALASILMTKMTGKLLLQLQRTANVASNQQAYWYALGAEAFAANVLKSAFNKEPKVTHLGQYWAQGETSYPVEQGQITGEIFDLQACFNLNALRAPFKAEGDDDDDDEKAGTGSSGNLAQKTAARLSFERLLLKVGLEDVDEFTAEYLADALTDWLDKDGMISSAGGAEDSDYSSKSYPYLAANHFLASVTELRAIEHFTPAIIDALKEYVCVIPDSDIHQVNINTLDANSSVLLEALLDISATDAADILAERDDDGFEKVTDLWTLASVSDKKISAQQKQQFTVDSEYFKLKTMASFNNSYVHLNTVFNVSNNKDIQVIARSIGRE